MNQTNPAKPQRRFRVNPVEVGIFGVACLIVTHSLYQLVSQGPDFHLAALAPMASRPTDAIRSGEADRAVASTITSAPAMGSLTVPCTSAPSEQDTAAEKVRLNGSICGASAEAKLAKVLVVNSANQYSATVFSDEKGGKFSTDYIPLAAGPNAVTVQFKYADGRSVSQALVIRRN